MTLETISLNPQTGGQPDYLLVLLHGWGANYNDLMPLAPMFNLPNYQFFFPNAPLPHPEVPGGRAWYHLESPNYDGIEQSRQQLHHWLLSLADSTGVPLQKTFVAGFSQGGAMILDVALKLPVAGICSLSGYLQFEPEKQASSLPPVLMCHGKNDLVVPVNLARQAKVKLESMGVNLRYQEYEMGHEIIPQEINLMREFILNL